MKIHFHGAVGMVTGSCYRVEVGQTRFLVDCGMFQGNKTLKERNYGDFPFDPAQIDAVLVTHAHIDHIGLLPKLVKKGFRGTIYATRPTADLMTFMLPDSARIQVTEVAQKNQRNERKGLPPLEPIYDEEDAERTLALIKGVDSSVTIGDSVRAVFRNAGHVLGSAFIEITLTEGGQTKKVVFSGDLGAKDHPIVEDPEVFTETDCLLVESTYGNRVRAEEKKKDRLKALATIVRDALKRGGNLIIPAFALERSQDLMHDLIILMDNREIPFAKVIIDSPLAANATKVFARYPELYDEDATALLKAQGSIFEHPNFTFTRSAEDSMALNGQKGLIIMSASGMCDAGRIKHHLKHNLWRRESTVLFVGYQAEGTLGRLLLDGAKVVRIHGEEVRVEAQIREITGYSGHADQNGLMEWIGSINAVRDRVFVVHGEDDARAELARLIREKKGFSVHVPRMGESFDLLANVAPAPAPGQASAAGAPAPAPAVTPAHDSFNLYADLTIRLAEFMRREKDESRRRTLLEELLRKM
ncbi:MAG: MBL fold metallo-hydrolase [Candidatus Riflebacteria bacterium]|nr:MBL fold metallo-hydrolase [Candidatus Riflebacteria bacterium]